MPTEKAGVRILFLLAFGIIFLIAGVLGLVEPFNCQTSYSFGTWISVISIMAGVYFILKAYVSRKNKVEWSTKQS